jgi:amidase
MLSLGDLHAAMADGGMVTGIEVAGEVQLKIDVIKNKKIENSILENENYFYTIAFDKNIYQACKFASNNMFSFL